MATATQNKIRIRLKAYDHSAIETAAKEIVETATRTGATVSGPVPLPTEKNVYCRDPVAVQGQGLAGALRDPDPQAPHRHPPADARRRSTRCSDSTTCPRASTSRSAWRADDGRDPRPQARHDAGLLRRRPRRARHRARGRAVSRHRDPHPRARRLRGRAARLRRDEGEAPQQARARPPAQGRRRRRSKHLVEFRDEAGELQVGETVTVEAFSPGTRSRSPGPPRARASRARSSATASPAAP